MKVILAKWNPFFHFSCIAYEKARGHFFFDTARIKADELHRKCDNKRRHRPSRRTVTVSCSNNYFLYSCVQLSVMSDNETSVRVEVCLTVFLMKHYKTGNDEEIIKQKVKLQA